MSRWIPLCVWLVACGGKGGDSAGGGTVVAAAPYMNILSPTPGEYLDVGDAVTLEAEGRVGDGSLAAVEAVTWSSDDGVFTAEGNPVTVTELHGGVYALAAEGVVNGEPVSASVDVVVYARR